MWCASDLELHCWINHLAIDQEHRATESSDAPPDQPPHHGRQASARPIIVVSEELGGRMVDGGGSGGDVDPPPNPIRLDHADPLAPTHPNRVLRRQMNHLVGHEPRPA
ncbi:hypothetical protein E2562_010659 [Oryza meyeriana var. granulata]|uniref:Uncharacterized protein n=1 Tax=Oryza meyeriana var. granulata TaxID=110450 RepID=A0A6G1EVY3_9ORYZ|nr:hypothetical protein E2562_010659 [Oryza meyeriana var. granulata]